MLEILKSIIAIIVSGGIGGLVAWWLVMAMGLGGTFKVWNGKFGQHEFAITCRDRKQAQEIADKINRKDHNGVIEVHK